MERYSSEASSSTSSETVRQVDYIKFNGERKKNAMINFPSLTCTNNYTLFLMNELNYSPISKKIL